MGKPGFFFDLKSGKELNALAFVLLISMAVQNLAGLADAQQARAFTGHLSMRPRFGWHRREWRMDSPSTTLRTRI